MSAGEGLAGVRQGRRGGAAVPTPGRGHECRGLGRGQVGRRMDERGVLTTEAAIVFVVLLFFIVLAVAAGAYATAKQNVVTAAEAAARAASIERTRGAAESAASAAAHTTLDQKSMRCAASVDTDTSGFAVPVGKPATISSTVTCTVDLSNSLPVPGLAHSVTLRATSTSPLDTFRERR